MGLISEFINSSSIVKNLRKELKEKDAKLEVLCRERDKCRNAEKDFKEWVNSKEFAVKNDDGTLSCFVTISSSQELNGALQKYKALKSKGIIYVKPANERKDLFIKVNPIDKGWQDTKFYTYMDKNIFPLTLEVVGSDFWSDFWEKSEKGIDCAYDMRLDMGVYCGANRAESVRLMFDKQFAYARSRKF